MENPRSYERVCAVENLVLKSGKFCEYFAGYLIGGLLIDTVFILFFIIAIII